MYHHSHAKQAVKFIIIIIIVWNVHDQVYIFMLVILMHSALCIYFILLNWCHDTASACLYSNCIVISNVMVEYEYIRILIMFTILIAQQLTAVKARYLWVGSVVLHISMAGHMIFNTVAVEHES